MNNCGINFAFFLIKKTLIMKKFMNFWGLYYPIILAFFSFVYSVILWFSGDKLEGIFVGIWVPSILSASVALRQRRSDYRDSKNK